MDKLPNPVDIVDNFQGLSTFLSSKIKSIDCYQTQSSVLHLTSEKA